MIFDYDLYLRGCLIFPIFVAAIAVPGLVSCVKNMWIIVLVRKEKPGDHLQLLAGIIVSCICCVLSIGPLLSGGLYLLVEKESDAIEIQGEITQIKEMPRMVLPALNNNYGFDKVGVSIVVDGQKCALPTSGILQVGDYATVRYLPQSGYVMDISIKSQEGEVTLQSPNRHIESVLAWMVIFVIAFMYFGLKRKK